MTMVAVDGNQETAARSRGARPREDDKASRPARQGFHLWSRRAVRELPLQHHVPDQQRPGERAQNRPHRPPPATPPLASPPPAPPRPAPSHFPPHPPPR